MTSPEPVSRRSAGRRGNGPGRARRARGDQTYTKPPLTHAELVERMRGRGLQIPDDDRAIRYLRQIGYYRLSPYMIPFQAGPGDHDFHPSTTFDDVLSLYVFDRQLRLLVMDGLERIEVATRAALTDHMANRTGDPHWYLGPDHFSDPHEQGRLLSQLRKTVDDQLERTAEGPGDRYTYPSALEHYLTHYNHPALPPSWVMVEELTIGQLNRVVANLANPADRTAIAAVLGINDTLLTSWLRSYVRVRNICAHHSRLWNRGLGVYPALPTSRHVAWLHDPTALTDPAHHYRARRLYPVLVSIHSILTTISPATTWPSRLITLITGHPTVPLRAMGIPPDWTDDPFWQRP